MQTGQPLVGAVLFPVGFCMLYLLGFDLLTGVFVLAPLALIDKRPGVTLGGVLRNWGLVFVGNFAGAFTVAVLMAIIFTFGFSTDAEHGRPGDRRHRREPHARLREARRRRHADAVHPRHAVQLDGVDRRGRRDDLHHRDAARSSPCGCRSWCSSTWRFEHSIVNMFLFPSGLLLGGNFSIMDYLIWNEIPTVLGNLVGGLAFTGLTLYATHVRTGAEARLRLIASECRSGPPPARAGALCAVAT